ncbi:DUF3048 domain-containing protein [Halobacillus amylolyticus]|uniref:DUF3048 domain-containing protein n=1 Tax=Halobacillus amylolyticus TaxID=2932259 RepID=A0ABY4H6T3_9BACI|nr:DUF3048 domain-containing protein [Halobacillus amylolyticus]UOR10197.1 DUF3048 domain-containing protein [Halobacillus amylolyticus]
MRKIVWLILAAIIMFVLTACANSAEDDSKQEHQDKEETKIEKEGKGEATETSDENVYPLTGEPADGLVDHRILSVMVNNHSDARPQTGLSKADIVYEVLAEGPITRFLALFHSEIPEVVGPVRSARPYYFKLASGYDALYVYHGAAAFINEMVKDSGIDFADGALHDNDGKLFKRSTDRKAPHNSYLLTSGLDALLEKKGYDSSKEVEPLPFADKPAFDGQSAQQVRVAYDELETVSYTYDPESGQYKRSSDGEPTIEKETNERVAVDNVFIVKTEHQVVDDAGRREIDLKSGGEGYLVQQGQMIEVEWKNKGGRILPFKDGEAVSFVPGKTWVNIVPDQPGIVTAE